MAERIWQYDQDAHRASRLRCAQLVALMVWLFTTIYRVVRTRIRRWRVRRELRLVLHDAAYKEHRGRHVA